MDKYGEIKIGGSYFAAISALDESLMVTVVDSENGKVVVCYPIKMNFKIIKEFVNLIPKMFTNFKVVILHLFCFQTTEYPNMIEFRSAIKEKLVSIKKPHHFMDEKEFFLSYLINTKAVSVKREERIVFIHNCDEDEYGVSEYMNTENGYMRVANRQIPAKNNSTTICKAIIGPNNPKQIILLIESNSPEIKRLLNVILKGKNVTTFNVNEIFPKAIVDAGKWILNNKQSKRSVIPCYIQDVSIGQKFGKSYYPLEIIKDGDALPVTKTFCTTKFMNDIIVSFYPSSTIKEFSKFCYGRLGK